MRNSVSATMQSGRVSFQLFASREILEPDKKTFTVFLLVVICAYIENVGR